MEGCCQHGGDFVSRWKCSSCALIVEVLVQLYACVRVHQIIQKLVNLLHVVYTPMRMI